MAPEKVCAISFAINAMLGAGVSSAMKQAVGGMERLKVKAFELRNEQKQLEKARREGLSITASIIDVMWSQLFRAHQTLFCLFTGQVFVLAGSLGVSRVSR